MRNDLTLAARLELDSQRWEQGTRRGMTATRRFVAGVRNEFAQLRGVFDGVVGQVAALGGGFAVANELIRSARMDDELTRIGQTANASQEQVRGLRSELFELGKETGRNVNDLQTGFATLIASGQTWTESNATLVAINKTMAVANAQAQTLAGTLGVASTAFEFDLAKPGQALDLLDRMTVAGRLGNAELENLGGIFSRVGVNAQRAGFGFDQTLAFIEGLSLIERQPERLATLADSTLRLFTNANYLRNAQEATGIRFFDEAGSRRDPLVVLAEVKKRFDELRTDAQRESFLSAAFGQADLDTIKGLSTLLTGDNLAKVNRFTTEISRASGTIERDLPKALADAVDQGGRLKNTLLDAADGFARVINDAFASVTKKLLDSPEQGGLGLSGGQLIGGGALGVLGLYGLGRAGKGLFNRLAGGTASLASGVAMGTALEQAGAATPVFIVGAAPGVFSGAGGGIAPGAAGRRGGTAGRAARRIGTAGLLGRGALALGGTSVGALAGGGAAGAATIAGGAGISALGGWGIGTGLYKLMGLTEWGRKRNHNLGREIAELLAGFGNDNAQRALDAERKLEITLMLDDLRSRVTGIRVNGDATVNTSIRSRAPDFGRMMASPGVR